MLTKEERAVIAERANECIDVGGSLYEVLLGHPSACNTTYEEDMKKLLARIVDLCDTSNMIELPLDKDGVPFKIGDTVYESDGTEHKVDGYAFTIDDAKILSMIGSNNKSYVAINPDELTHKKPVTIKSLAQRIKHVLEDEATSIGVNPYVELGRIAEQLESLGDSDD